MNAKNSKFTTAGKVAKIISWSLLGLMILGLLFVSGILIFNPEYFTAYVNGQPELDSTWIILCYSFAVCGFGLPALFVAVLAKNLNRAGKGQQ